MTESKDPVQRQLDRLEAYDLVKDGDLAKRVARTRTTYYSQRDNHTMPHRTCNATSNAMYLDWLRRVTGRESLGGDDGFVSAVFKHGDTIYHHNQTAAIKDYGFSTKWMTDRDLDFVQDLVKAGFPVVVNILHRGTDAAPRGGHVIMLIGYREKSKVWVCHDPYGTIQSNYKTTNGRFANIPASVFVRRWQGGYRILA